MAAATNSLSPERSIRIRSAENADREAIARLINAAFIVERIAFDGDRIDVAGVGALMEKGTFLLAEDAPGLIGCVYVEVRGERSYLGLLSVAPARQGTGLGRRLVAEVERFARAAKCSTMWLRILSARSEELLPFYHRFGYKVVETLPLPPEFSPKVPCHFVVLEKSLA